MSVELVVVKGPHRGLAVTLEDAEVYLGRSQSAQLALCDDKKVSQLHAKLKLLDTGRYLIEDLGSTNGTYVNGRRLEAIPLRTGDRVRIGHSLMVYRSDEEGDSSGSIDRGFLSEDSELADASESEPGSEVSTWEPFPTKNPASAAARGMGSAFFGVLSEIVSRLERRSTSQGFDDIVQLIAVAIGARRGIMLLRDAMSGATTPLAVYCADGVSPESVINAEVIKEVIKAGRAVAPSFELRPAPTAAPLRVGGALVGVLYFDSPGFERSVVEVETFFLEAAARAVSMALTQERQRRLAEATADILDLAVMGGTRLPIELSVLLQSVLNSHAEQATLRQVAVTVAIPPGLAVVGDELFVRQALERLIAYVLSIAAGAVRVAARAVPERREVQISVGYTGRGFDDVGRSRVFHVDGVGRDLRFALHRGLDPALAICRSLVELSRGSIVVTSAGVEAGASFVIAFPAGA